MSNTEQIHDGTRQRILAAAAEVFVNRGYRSATIREICQRAGANIAAVNYHFGDKGSLYRELLLSYPSQSFGQHPVGNYLREGMSGEELLGAFVHDFLNRLLNPGRPGWHAVLLAREMVEPTEALDEMVSRFIRPQMDVLAQVIRAIAGREMPASTVGRCIESVIPQIVFHVNARAVILKIHPQRIYDEAEIARIAEHIAAFSIAGIRAVATKVTEGGVA